MMMTHKGLKGSNGGHTRRPVTPHTALLESVGARGATKLHADEREQLLAAGA
jgi:hypothetical protein